MDTNNILQTRINNLVQPNVLKSSEKPEVLEVPEVPEVSVKDERNPYRVLDSKNYWVKMGPVITHPTKSNTTQNIEVSRVPEYKQALEEMGFPDFVNYFLFKIVDNSSNVSELLLDFLKISKLKHNTTLTPEKKLHVILKAIEYINNAPDNEKLVDNIPTKPKGPFFPKETGELDKIKNAKIDSEDKQKVMVLKSLGLNIDAAIACLNFDKLEKIEEFIRLTKSHTNLDSEDIIGIMTYEIEDIGRYQEIKNKYVETENIDQSAQSNTSKLEKYEALLATKLKLNDEQIKIYLEKKGTTICSQKFTYIPSADEWMAFIKAGFDDSDFEKIPRYKNLKRDLTKKTVRKKGGEQKCSMKYIIKAIQAEKVLSKVQIDKGTYEKIKGHTNKLDSDTSQSFNISNQGVTQSELEDLPKDFWYQTSMGCEKETYDIMQKAIGLMCSNKKDDDFKISSLVQGDVTGFLSTYDGRWEFNDSDKLDQEKAEKDVLTIYRPQDTQGNTSEVQFSVQLTQGIINGKPVLIIEEKNPPKENASKENSSKENSSKENPPNRYIAYNGAIVPVKALRTNNSEQFKAWANLLPEEQAKVLAEAANAFPFDLFDENGHCIIGQNISGKDIKNMKKDEIGEEFCELKKNNELTPQNILKLMPKDCMLSINPYIEGNELLYAVAAEWYSKDENGNEHKWQLEIHSPNLEHQKDEKWVFRLHYEDPNNTTSGDKEARANRKYFQFVDENTNIEGVNNGDETKSKGYNFNGGYKEEAAHIEIESPLKDYKLLNDIDFQKIMKNISKNLCKNFAINNIARALGLGIGENDSPEVTMRKIVDHCLHNVSDFAKYKDEILKMRAALGCYDLS